MKVLFVSPAGAAYGSERSMLALLHARQFIAEVVCPAGGALDRELQALGVLVHPLGFGKYSVRQNPLWHVGFYRRFRQILRASRPDVVGINLDGNTPLVTLATAQVEIPIVRFCRFEFKPPTRRLDRWCWLKPKAIICPTELVRQQFLAWAPAASYDRVHRFYEPHTNREAPSEAVTACRRELNANGARLIGYVGRLHRGKRIEVAIRALAEVRRRIGDVRLLIVGEHDGSPAGAAYQAELKQIAVDLGIAEGVRFTGYCSAERLPAIIAACQVCVLPSESESFGMVLMEAWAQGVPTVASDAGGCREITEASGAGFLVPVGDVPGFSGRLTDLLSAPEAARATGQKGRAWVAQNCSPTRYAANFKLLLDRVVSGTE